MTNSDGIFTAQLRTLDSSGSPSRPARVASQLIKAYQRVSSGRPSPCRFYPSCSNYALEALSVHGAWYGLWLAVRRVVRCRPLGPHGIDLVPQARRSTRSWK